MAWKNIFIKKNKHFFSLKCKQKLCVFLEDKNSDRKGSFDSRISKKFAESDTRKGEIDQLIVICGSLIRTLRHFSLTFAEFH